MPNSYDWNIIQLDTQDVQGAKDVVKTIYYEVIATAEDGTSGRIFGAIQLDEQRGGSRVPFPSLTKARVEKWVREALSQGEETDSETKSRIEKQLDTEVEKKKEPPIKNRIPPWVKTQNNGRGR